LLGEPISCLTHEGDCVAQGTELKAEIAERRCSRPNERVDMIGLVLLMIAATTDSLGDRSDHQPIYNPASATSGTRKENLIFRLKLPRELHERILAELLYLASPVSLK
jgi:hypothetical protein